MKKRNQIYKLADIQIKINSFNKVNVIDEALSQLKSYLIK